jgi:phospholipid N-methyltransferase
MEKVLPKVVTKDTVFVQFSYMKSTKNMLEKYFENVETEICLLNIPSAFVLTCK